MGNTVHPMTSISHKSGTYRTLPSPTTAAQTGTGFQALPPARRDPAEAASLCAGLDGTQGSRDARPALETGTGRCVPVGVEWGGDRLGGLAFTAPPCSARQALYPGAGDPVHTCPVWETRHGDRNHTHSRGPDRQGQRLGQLRRHEGKEAGLRFSATPLFN